MIVQIEKEKLMILISCYEDFKDILNSFPTALGDYFEYDIYEDIEIVDDLIDEIRKCK